MSGKEIVINCPHSGCGKVFSRKLSVTTARGETRAIVEFESRCPHCQRQLRVHIGFEAIAMPPKYSYAEWKKRLRK